MKLGSATAFAAEAALWISGAALIASAAGMSWSVDVSSLVGSQASASASASPSASPSATVAVESLAPGASPTMSPVVRKFQTELSRPNFQYKAKLLMTMTGTIGTTPFQLTESGTTSVVGSDQTYSYRMTTNGSVTTYDQVYLGDYFYESVNGGSWTKAAQSDAGSSAGSSDQIDGPGNPLMSSAVTFVDMGPESKNGQQLHRLELVDQSAFNSFMQKSFGSGTTASDFTYTVWVNDDGVLTDIHIQGSVTWTASGKKVSATMNEELRIFALSGVTITAPI